MVYLICSFIMSIVTGVESLTHLKTFSIVNDQPKPAAVLYCDGTTHINIDSTYGWVKDGAFFDTESRDGTQLHDICFCKQQCEIPALKLTEFHNWTLYVKYQCGPCNPATQRSLQSSEVERVISKSDCDLLSVPGNTSVFKQYVEGTGYIVMPCAPGTVFNQNQCHCSDFAPVGYSSQTDANISSTMDIKAIVIPAILVVGIVVTVVLFIMYIRSRRRSSRNLDTGPAVSVRLTKGDNEHEYDEVVEQPVRYYRDTPNNTSPEANADYLQPIFHFSVERRTSAELDTNTGYIHPITGDPPTSPETAEISNLTKCTKTSERYPNTRSTVTKDYQEALPSSDQTSL